MSTETETKTWFTKTLARETVQAKTADLLEEGEISAEVKEQLDNLFAGRTTVSNTLVRDEDGHVVMKRCSYFGGYLPIEDFGTVGKDDEGNLKYSYQSKEGAKAARAAKTKLAEAITAADEALEETEDVAAWKQAKADAVAESEVKAEYDGESTMFATYEDALESIA